MAKINAGPYNENEMTESEKTKYIVDVESFNKIIPKVSSKKKD